MSSQTKVGLLFLFALAAVFLFVGFLGQISPFGGYEKLIVTYNFAGGIEQGSHVRLMGIKVGKVEKVEFQPDYKTESGEEVKLHVHIKVKKKAFPVVRADSRYYINLAGIIGEKYLEISPGSSAAASLKPGQYVRGVDPPRIDQMISQGYALAGKILSMVENNEDSVVDTIGSINSLVDNLNRVLVTVDKLTTNKQYRVLFERVALLSKELTVFVQEAKGGDVKKSLRTIRKLLSKLEKIDEKEIRQFLQEEGIRARVSL